MDLATMTGKAGTIKLNGRTFLLNRLTVGDYGMIQAWMKEKLKRPFQIVAEALKDMADIREIDPETYERNREQLMLSAMADSKADAFSASQEAMQSLMNSPDGIAFLLWLSINPSAPEVTLENVTDWIKREDIGEIQTKLDRANSMFPNDEDVVHGDPTVPAGLSEAKQQQ